MRFFSIATVLFTLLTFGCSADVFDVPPMSSTEDSGSKDVMQNQIDSGIDAGKTPIILADNQGSPVGIAVDSNNVYWTNSFTGTVMQCNVNGCDNSPLTLSSNQGSPNSITTDGSNVYWTNTTTNDIKKCSVNGCQLTPTLMAGNQSVPWGIAIKGSDLYWTASGGNFDAGPVGNRVMHCLTTNCSGTMVEVANKQNPYQITINSDKVYWSNLPDKISSCLIGTTCGDKPIDAVSTTGAVYGIAFNTTDMFFTNFDTGAIFKCSKNGCNNNPILMVNGQNKPYQIVADDQFIYWTDSGSGNIKSCSVAGCNSPTILASNQGMPKGIAMDNVAIYWVNSSSNTVMKLYK